MSRLRTYIHPEQLSSPASKYVGEYFTCYHDGLYDDAICQGQIAIRRNWPSDQIKRLAAGFMSTRMGISLQQTYKKYIANQPDIIFPDHQLDVDIEDSLVLLKMRISEAYDFVKPEDSKEGEFFAGTSLFKAFSALSCAHHLAQRGYLLEPLTLTRTALEIIAWSRSCIGGKEGRAYLSLTTTSAITQARSSLPGLGRLYGVLSKFAHWHPDVHLAFLSYDVNVNVTIRSTEYKPSALLAVSTSYLFALTTFINLIQMYWATVDLANCIDAGRQLINNISNMREKIGDETKFQRLFAELIPCWESATDAFLVLS